MSLPQSRPTISKELIVFLIPLLGSALAVTYDVGFFSAIGLENFSFFSLGEHIVFALGFFPFALLIAFVFAALALMFDRRTPTQPQPEYVTWRQRILSGVAVLLGLLLAGGVAYVAFLVFPPPIVWDDSAIIYSVVSIMFLSGVAFRKALGYAASGGLILASAVILAFTFGNLRANSILHPGPDEGGVLFQQGLKTIETKKSGQIEARIFNSGDRGVLFFDTKANQITLLGWDEIRQITMSLKQ
jgi:hypothetical protein